MNEESPTTNINMNEESTSNIEFDLNEMSKEELIDFIVFAHKNDYTFNQALVAALEAVVTQLENTEKL